MTTFTELVTTCLGEIERKYGTGLNDGEFPKIYHNKEHTENVIADAMRIAELAQQRHKINERQKTLLHLAAAFHDIEQNSIEYGNELASSDIMDLMATPTQIFTADELLEVREIILGTEMVTKQGILTQVYAQSYLAQALADADLAALEKSVAVYTDTSEKFYHELYPEDTIENHLLFLNSSLSLLKNHHYFTAEAEYYFPEQGNNLEYVKDLIATLT